jgi:hypothetical protein
MHRQKRCCLIDPELAIHRMPRAVNSWVHVCGSEDSLNPLVPPKRIKHLLELVETNEIAV